MLNKILRTSLAPVVLFALAAVLIGYGGVQGAAAAPAALLGDYDMRVQLSEIGTALVENGSEVPDEGTLLGSSFLSANGLESAEGFQVGKTYAEELSVRNTGDIDEYVRVTVRVYWVNSAGEEIKQTDLKPEYIQLGAPGAGWSVDEAASTPERTVLYYGSPVAAGGSTSSFATTLTIDPATLTALKGSEYAYEGVTFKIDATVDAVQTHNGEDAMRSAWGRTI